MSNRIIRGLSRRTLLGQAGAVLVAGLAWPAQAKALPISQAINRAGRLRALSQRLSKAYVQAALEVLPDRAQDILANTQQLLAGSLAELSAGGGPADLQAQLTAVERDHRALVAAVGGRPRREAGLDVARTADTLLESANRLTQAYESQSRQASARIVNVAGRQRMLSQRAARAYFLAAAGHDSPAVRNQLATARSEFGQGLVTLQAAAISTPAIRNELELARSQWLFQEAALARAASPETLQTVATTSERVYEVMDNLTALYDAALRDLL
ncbi:type IV pili methyl-accepting chemotaxis transducer N-terminal domain-containing protein [Ramlibacter sp.]|uniref:type IV pili methyl-accepting chemotaxis transducer N-terminal domain-containing protein n=1 Tax=Ramlibacter sp. TaxID=1917967 RepID=UPI0035B29F4E